MKNTQMAIAISALFAGSNKPVTVNLPNGYELASGKGLDGQTDVHSLKIAESPEHNGTTFIQGASAHPTNDVWLATNGDELYVATKRAAGKKFRVTSTPVRP